MRALGMSGKDVQLTGVAAATSHLHDLQYQVQLLPKVRSWDGDTPGELMDMLSGDSDLGRRPAPQKRRVSIMTGREDVELDVPIAPEVDGADQFKATFDQVKADLAAGRWASSDDDLSMVEEQSRRGSDGSIAPSPMSIQSQSCRLPSRSQIIQTKILDLETRIVAAQHQLEADMRFVRNIATLTPFQRATRDRLTLAVQGVSKRVMQVRLDIAKLVCHRDVLFNDLASQNRNWVRTKKVALKAATETLQSRCVPKSIPKMTLSLHDQSSGFLPSPQTLDTSSSHRPESSACESFHSAIDFGPEWPSSDDLSSSSFLDTFRPFDSPELSGSGSFGSYPFLEMESPSINNQERFFRTLSTPGQTPGDETSPRNSEESRSHERFYTAQELPEEEAEEWNKTRGAQRVSLVRLPSDIRMSAHFEKPKLLEKLSSSS